MFFIKKIKLDFSTGLERKRVVEIYFLKIFREWGGVSTLTSVEAE